MLEPARLDAATAVATPTKEIRRLMRAAFLLLPDARSMGMESSFKYVFPANRVHPKVRLQQKLHPQRFPQMPPVMSAVVGYLVDAEFADPLIQEMTVTTAGAVLRVSITNPVLAGISASITIWFATGLAYSRLRG